MVLRPNECIHISLIKACADNSDFKLGKLLHGYAWRYGHQSNAFVSSALVDMYGKCNRVLDAEHVFYRLPHLDVVSWTSILYVYVYNGLKERAINLYIKMKDEGVDPNERTIAVVLQGCCMLAEKEVQCLSTDVSVLDIGRLLHANACLKGLDTKLFICNNLVRLYGTFGCVSDAEDVFFGSTEQNVVSWTTMLSIYVNQGMSQTALKLYRKMHEFEVDLDERCFLAALKACYATLIDNETRILTDDLARRKELCFEVTEALHSRARRRGFDSDVFISNTLVHIYCKCDMFKEAENVFSKLRKCDLVSWTLMISAYSDNGQTHKALQLYQHMQQEGISPDERTVVSVLKACSKHAETKGFFMENVESNICVALQIGKVVHGDAVIKGFDSDIYFTSALMAMYGDCGSVLELEQIFHGVNYQDKVMYNIMLITYIQQGRLQKALELYYQMIEKNIKLEDTTQGHVLKVCGDIGNAESCHYLHHSILWMKNELCLLLRTALIYAYGSCGNLTDADSMLNSISKFDVVSWNALMMGCVRGGNSKSALVKFKEMQAAHVKPNNATFLPILIACCQNGLVEKGVEIFQSMYRDHYLDPGTEHYGVMVDLLGRAGEFEKLEVLLSGMPLEPDMDVWLGLLSASRVYGNQEFGKKSFDSAMYSEFLAV